MGCTVKKSVSRRQPWWPLYRVVLALGVAFLLVSCRHQDAGLQQRLSRVQAPPGLEQQQVRTYGRANLYDLVDGQAESYLAYGFVQVVTARYRDSAGVVLEVDIWQVATPSDAYGLWTVSRAGEPGNVGNDSDAEPGRRIAFWQDHYYVHVWARQRVDDAELRALARAVAAGLPGGGKRPALLARLPAESRQGSAPVFFHQEISIQNEVWLGGTNLLGLSQETSGVLARYTLAGGRVHLLLIEYPKAAQAATAVQALQAAPVDDLQAAGVQGRLMAVVIGSGQRDAAQRLVQLALEAR
jgi:hypothetical protein